MRRDNTSAPTREEVEELLAFLPVFSANDFQPVRQWHGGRAEDGTMTFPWPEYHPEVTRFFEAASEPCWQDWDYTTKDAGSMLADSGVVKRATLDQFRTMLTYCVRGERFCDGHLGSVIEAGYLVRLLERLSEIADGQAESGESM